MACKKNFMGGRGKPILLSEKFSSPESLVFHPLLLVAKPRAVAKRLSICCRGFKLVPESNWKIET